MSPDSTTHNTSLGIDSIDEIRARYVELTGSVPPSIERRLTLAVNTDRIKATQAIEALRQTLIMENPLGRKTGQLVHFAQLLALGKAEAAKLHAGAARKAGASYQELVGVAELALITSGMPSYALGVEIITDLIEAEKDSDANHD